MIHNIYYNIFLAKQTASIYDVGLHHNQQNVHAGRIAKGLTFSVCFFFLQLTLIISCSFLRRKSVYANKQEK